MSGQEWTIHRSAVCSVLKSQNYNQWACWGLRHEFWVSSVILTNDLRMRHVSAKFVPKLLSAEQKDTQLFVANDLMVGAENNKTFSLWVWPRNQGTILTVEDTNLSKTSVHCKWPELHESADWLLHHDNASAHTSQLVQQFLSKHQITQVCQHLYLSNDFFVQKLNWS